MNDTYEEMEDEVSIPWNKIRKEIYTPEELIASELQAELIIRLVKARNEKNLTQKQLEALTGIKQPAITRIENGRTDIKVSTMLKLLTPLGLTLKIEPIDQQ